MKWYFVNLTSTGFNTGDIKKFINKELEVFSQTGSKSVYYSLKKMEKEGLVKRRVLKQKKHLRKYLYSITSKGERAFSELCRRVLLSQKRPFIELDIAIYFMSFLDRKKIMPLLRLRLRFLEAVKKWLISKKSELKQSPKNLALLVNHHLKLAVAERDFLEDMITLIKSGGV